MSQKKQQQQQSTTPSCFEVLHAVLSRNEASAIADYASLLVKFESL